MESRRWLNPSQPQTLQIAVFLLYFHAAFAAIDLLFGASGWPVLFTLAGGVAGGNGIANERKWGYGVGVATAFIPFVTSVLFFQVLYAYGIISLLFDVALVALLLHPQSRGYQRIWFK